MNDKVQALLGELGDKIAAFAEEEMVPRFDPENPVIRLHEPTFGAEEAMALLEPVLTTWVTQGPKTKELERCFADMVTLNHGVANNSGSSANLLALAALCSPLFERRMVPGDEVIVSALSWSTTVWPLVQMGLVPVVVDIDPETLNLDLNEVEKAISPKTRAIMPVHVYGNPCDMDGLVALCQKHELFLIEDCCEALGAKYDGKPVSSFGDVGTFSFYFSHHVTSLEGGICVTNDAELNERMRVIRSHGWVRDIDNPQPYFDAHSDIDPRFLFVEAAYNLRITEPQSSMGLVQLPKLAGFVEQRRVAAKRMQDALSGSENLLQVQREADKGYHSWFGLPLTISRDAGFTVTEIRAFLAERHIESRPIICGNIAAQPGMKLYDHRVVGDMQHANHVMSSSFSVANHQNMCEQSSQYMAGAFAEWLGRY